MSISAKLGFLLIILFSSTVSWSNPILKSAEKVSTTISTQALANDTLCYELRIYTCNKGKLNDLMKRFRTYTTKIFESHGMTNVGYWTPLDNPDEKIYYILSYPNRAAREASWKAFKYY